MKTDLQSDCIVIGAGPAGLAAAIHSARERLSVRILEKGERPGRKLLMAGGGRANLLDPKCEPVAALDAFGRSGRFLRQTLAAFEHGKFLKSLGVEIEQEPDGKVYVVGGAKKLLEALLAECARRKVVIEYGAAVTAARRLESGGFAVETSRGEFTADTRLVLATGGMTYPSTGSTGDGYRLAATFGHEVVEPRAALSALVTKPAFPELAGVSVADAALELAGGKTAPRARGPLLVTHTGFSGPAALDLSLEMARQNVGVGSELRVDLAPAVSRDELAALLVARARAETKRTLENSGLEGLPVPARLGVKLAERAGLDPRRRMGSLSDRDFMKLAGAAKALVVGVQAAPSAEHGMVTVGGISTKNLDPHTMESRLVPGLRFAGELLEPAGPCGGYNLLMAFATGWAAGTKAE